MAEALPTFPSFVVDSDDSAGVRWTKWVSRFRNLMVAVNIVDRKRQRALLLHYAGEEVNDILDTLPDAEAAEGEDPFEKAVTALNKFFTPKQNIEYQIYTFRQSKQQTDEPLTAYYTRLKQLATSCSFDNVDREIKSQIIQGCLSSTLRRKALCEPDMTLTKLIDVGRSLELSDIQAKSMENEHVNKLSLNRNKQICNNSKKTADMKCHNCGGTWPHEGGKTSCPAHGKYCNSCKKPNHFASQCRSKDGASQQPPHQRHRDSISHDRPQSRLPKTRHGKYHRVRRVNADSNGSSSDNSEHSSEQSRYVYALSVHSNRLDTKRNLPHFLVNVNNTTIDVIADSGASVSIMSQLDFSKIKPVPQLHSNYKQVFAYCSQSPLKVLGTFRAVVRYKDRKSDTLFYVIDSKEGSLLSWEVSQALHLLHVVKPIGERTTSTDQIVNELVTEYADLFRGVGKLKDFQVKLHIDNAVQPVAQPHRRVPFHVRQQLEDQLKHDEELDIIEMTEGATPWVSPVVVVPKPKSETGQKRVCVDMRQANTAIKRERHITPTINELISDLNGATVFSKLDLNQGYNQLELAPESRYITTFSTHVGLRRYKRLNFGISCAAEIFQNAIRETLSGLTGAINISDDILVYENRAGDV